MGKTAYLRLVVMPASAFGLEAQMKTFTVGPIIARPGEQQSAMIEVAAAADPGKQIPMTVMHGSKPGPVLVLVAGNHGCECPAVLALQRLNAGVVTTPPMSRGEPVAMVGALK